MFNKTYFVKTASHYAEYEYYKIADSYMVRVYHPRSYSKILEERLIKEFVVTVSELQGIPIKTFVRNILIKLRESKRRQCTRKNRLSKLLGIPETQISLSQLGILQLENFKNI